MAVACPGADGEHAHGAQGAEATGDPAAGQPAAVQAAFQRLRGQFIAGLPQRWRDICQAPDAARQREALHRLAGAAGSYGLVALGEAARQAEAQSPTGDAAALQAALQRLEQQLRAAGATVA
jgi:HPt (histidine-containing phosphotransfer) domain-containing protein